jgi:hypothetical protein
MPLFATIPLNDNHLINGGFNFFQRQAPGTATARSDDTYGPDRWYVLTQTAAVNVERSTGDTASLHAAKITQNQAGAQRCGLAQIVEGVNSRPFRSRSVRFQARIKCSASQAIRVAVLEWTGTADAATSDVVSDWTSGTYTTSNFFIATTTTVVGVAAVTPGAATWTDLAVVGNVSSSCNNLIVFVWTEGTAAQNVTLEVTEAGLYDGTAPRPWLPRSTSEEFLLCQRYFQKSYSADQNPGTNVLEGARALQLNGLVSADYWIQSVALQTPMRAAPTITLYDVDNASITAGKVSYVIAGSFVANNAGTADLIGTNGCRVYTDNATAGKQGFGFQFTAVSEL